MSSESSFKRGTNNSFYVDLEGVIKDKMTPFSYMLDEDKKRYYEDFLNESCIRAWKLRGREKSKYGPINEASRNELLSGADVARKQRSKHIYVRYMGVTGARGWIKFQSNSQYTPGRKYIQYIKMNDAKDMRYFKEFKKREIIRLFLSGDLSVYCSCPDFRYRQKYMAYNIGYGIFKELRYPKLRNPKLEGTVCKHLIAVLTVLNNNWMAIARDMKKTKFFKRKADMEDE